MDADQVKEGASAGDTAAADATAGMKPMRQEEQGQQSRQEATYQTVDCGNCWYHEDAVKTDGK